MDNNTALIQGKHWYTYVLIDPRTGEPFYVGKGTGKRVYAYARFHNRGVKERIEEIKRAGLKVIHEKWIDSEDATFCYWMEIYLIDYFGRKNLCNISGGGPGLSGDEHPSKNPKIRAKLSAKKLGPLNPNFGGKTTGSAETRIRMRTAQRLRRTREAGKHLSEEATAKLRTLGRLRMSGTTHPEERKRKIGESVKKSLAILPEEKKKRLSHKGAENGFFGKTHTSEARTRMRTAAKTRKREPEFGKQDNVWFNP